MPCRTNVETLKSAERKVRVPGELVYEYTPLVTRVVEYGASADALLSGRVVPSDPNGENCALIDQVGVELLVTKTGLRRVKG
jgi:hypothetical protein